MIAIATILATIVLSLLITRVATVALTVTGLSKEAARFQARSAFTGVGFTTSEAESVVGHPLRRRVILLLMLLGNAGLITILASFLLSFAGAEGARDAAPRILMLVAGLIVILLLAKSRAFDRLVARAAGRFFKRFTDLDVRDYAELLQLTGGYGVIELEVHPDHWVADRTLEDLDLRREGIALLGIERAGGFIGVPRGETTIETGDILVMYGYRRHLRELRDRPPDGEGDRQHRDAVERRRGDN